MNGSLSQILDAYDPKAPLELAFTIPGPWYTDPGVAELERRAVFGRTWQVLARTDQLENPGQFVTAEIAGEPLLAVRGGDGTLRAFFNVCRHHATPVITAECGEADKLRCGYHGWTYNLQGALRGMTDWDGVADFDRARFGLVPIRVETWESFVFVNLDPQAPPLLETVGALAGLLTPLGLKHLHFFERRTYVLACNWKVFVDNYLDGGYHVPHMHKGLNSVLEYADYSIENGSRYCVQSSPMARAPGEADVAAVRKGERAHYLWLHPNFMINCYEGTMDTNLVRPLGIDRCHVTFDFYFDDVSEARREANSASVQVADRVQGEDVAICEGVQKGLGSRAYGAGRLSVRREAGEHLFHRLLHADLSGELARR
jgi:phenylpropionate dioxygenase-like ring-hydroxylating dioxygenase large terminal subunit